MTDRLAPLVPIWRGIAMLALAMVATFAAVGALALWDANRESAAGLDDFAEEQATLAQALAVSLKIRLQSLAKLAAAPAQLGGDHRFRVRLASEPKFAPTDADSLVLTFAAGEDGKVVDVLVTPAELFAAADALEHRAGMVCLIQPPGAPHLLSLGGVRVLSTPVLTALGSSATSVRLSRAEAAALGLPQRIAMAGLAHVDLGDQGSWGVATVASAERLRDRQLRSTWRLNLSIAVAGALVLIFGGLALVRQRRTFDLQHRLTVMQLQSERDERLAKANRAATLGTLAMGIAHEISTPLGIIAARADQLASRTNEPQKVQQLAQVIGDQTQHLVKVIRSFMSLVRGDKPASTELAPADLVRSACQLVAHVFEKDGVLLKPEVVDSTPRLFGDRQLLEHALVNLLLNACHACTKGGTVEVTVRSDGAAVAFIVADDGHGVSEAVAARATEPFFTTKTNGDARGAGLGLAIVNEIIKAHRGQFGLVARSPRGTRATIELPIAHPVTASPP